MRWILAAIVATTLAWIMFISRSHRVTAFIVNKLVLWFNGIESGTPETILAHHPWVLDPKEELERLEAERNSKQAEYDNIFSPFKNDDDIIDEEDNDDSNDDNKLDTKSKVG